MRAGKNSTRNAAIGPYTIVTNTTWIQTSAMSATRFGFALMNVEVIAGSVFGFATGLAAANMRL